MYSVMVIYLGGDIQIDYFDTLQDAKDSMDATIMVLEGHKVQVVLSKQMECANVD